MSKLTWGKPKLETTPLTDGAIPATPTWVVLPDSEKDTSQLEPKPGPEREAVNEGSETIDFAASKDGYTFTTDIFLKKGMTRPFTDNDGLIAGEHAIRLTPEDDTNEGWLISRSVVKCETRWNSAKGTMLRYIFRALKPETGNTLQPYTKPTT
ncbi:MAG: hypothetical protein A2X18_07720 [Bacteroidetes bacterium GWF2_40_14]|nr:MAG: hypothetical protein A2X18_07720 [Bacteroidetes bacterium GWF2_40_14]